MSSEKLCGSAAHSWAEGVDTSTIITQAAPTAIAAAVKFCLFISCAPDSISDADENDGPSHHCDRGWRNCQMIVDRLDTGYAFHGNSGCFFFIIGSDKSPQVDGAVADRHVEHRWPPQLRIQSGKHLVTDLRIASACGGCVLCRHACECLKQVCTADDPHNFSILHDRYPLDAVSFQQHRNLAERRLRRRGDHRARHDIGDLVRMRFHIFRGEDLFAGQIFQPPGTAPLGSCLGPPHEVALAHDSKELVLLVDAGHGADAVGEKATSSTRAFGRTLMTAETITSAAFMSHTFSGDIG